MSIFISIASYQDPLLASTLVSAYEHAKNQAGLIFGVCDQSDEPINLAMLPFVDQIHYEHVNPLLSKGPCWARGRLQSFFNNEDYFLQIDSHTQFNEGWDVRLINELQKIEGNKSQGDYHAKSIITSYPRSFKVVDLPSATFELNAIDKNTQILAYRADSLFSRSSFSRQVGISCQHNEITHGCLLAAGCIFSRGAFVKDIPYDPNYYFYGEELSMALRAFTNGYSLFHIPDLPLFHLYTETGNVPRKLHWDQEDDKNRAIKWHEREELSLNRLDALFAWQLDGNWGLGSRRSLEEYAYISGMDLKNKIVLNLEKATKASLLESLDWKVNPLST